MPDYELKSAVLKIKSKPLNFALYKGDKESQVLITSKPASPKQITAIEKEIGDAKRIAKGICFYENDQLVFGTKGTPSPTWETTITKVFKTNECGKYLPITVRQLGENESDEAQESEESEGEETPSTGTPTPSPENPTAKTETPVSGTEEPKATDTPAPSDMEQFKARLAKLVPDIAAAAVIDAGIAQTAKLKASEGAVFARKNDFDQAFRLLTEAEKLIKETKPSTIGSDLKTDYENALLNLEEKIATALQDQIGDTGKIRAVDAFMREKAAAGNYQSALQALDGLKKLLGIAAVEDPMGDYKVRVKGLVPLLKEAIGANREGAADQRQLMLDANALAEKKQFAEANALLDQVAKWLTSSGQGTEDKKEEEDQLKTMPVWQKAKDVVNQQIVKLQAKLKETEDPDFIRIAEYGMNGLTKRLQVGMQVALMNLDVAEGDAREKAKVKVRAMLNEFESFLAGDRMVAVLEDNPFGVTMTVRSTLGKALASIKKSLS